MAQCLLTLKALDCSTFTATSQIPEDILLRISAQIPSGCIMLEFWRCQHCLETNRQKRKLATILFLYSCISPKPWLSLLVMEFAVSTFQ